MPQAAIFLSSSHTPAGSRRHAAPGTPNTAQVSAIRARDRLEEHDHAAQAARRGRS